MIFFRVHGRHMDERRAKRRDEYPHPNVEARLRVLKLRDGERLQSSRSGQDRIEVIVGKLAPQRHKVVVVGAAVSAVTVMPVFVPSPFKSTSTASHLSARNVRTDLAQNDRKEVQSVVAQRFVELTISLPRLCSVTSEPAVLMTVSGMAAPPLRGLRSSGQKPSPSARCDNRACRSSSRSPRCPAGRRHLHALAHCAGDVFREQCRALRGGEKLLTVSQFAPLTRMPKRLLPLVRVKPANGVPA